ncbi:uncharacterized protein Z520_00586 [Fonsecaea multimorphosa CBS 102226]|uniref:ASTRA-associated protein 1 n=1 Tax=Fonsecaea multimorphosa CBS 102226 TaxID=1442371 RepID=A0A0D2KKC4_9EURO|nr:uncharacterized protein Z520_00586 [Fonsecaea multimorphosa CBS 102226]KIY03895.1 hypothetical protein Z520_00586 [Fonsecaea multimorphosa CBS 102226]
MEPSPAVPAYILRGHEAAVHALHFYADNALLASGDSDGWMVIWSLSSKRPVAVWKAHEAGILHIEHWTTGRLVSHGRDHKLRVWQLRQEDLAGLSTKLPSESDGSAAASSSSDHPQPWLLHSMSVNALNFCAFSICHQDPRQPASEEAAPQLIASPNGLDSGGIDIFQLPSERRVSQIRSDKDSPTGMVMAVCLFHQTTDTASRLVLVSGYEDGRITVHSHAGDLSNPNSSERWQKITSCKAHTQPILSLAMLPSKTHFLTSSADSLISKFCLPSLSNVESKDLESEKSLNTKHSGQQGLSVRSDGKIFATAGWDGRVRVYSCKTMKELAVLKWHKVGCYSTAFAIIDPIVTLDADVTEDVPPSSSASPGGNAVLSSNTATKDLTQPRNALDMIKQQREEKARRTHWLGAGGKDGKISLWDIY